MTLDGKQAAVMVLFAITAGCGDDGGGGAPDGGVVDSSVDAAFDAAPPDAALDGGDAAIAPVIVEPADGTALRARRQRFSWTATGSNYRLRIGTAPGAADLYDSPPLGDATSVIVDGLPLTGATIYAELRSGPDDAPLRSRHTYQAPLRRALAVVVDFADVQLEDWTGPGMNDLADVRAQLDDMEAHWDWLSRGLERTQWDVVRIQLATDLSDTAFSWWGEFRDEVARLTLQQVSVADYDVDSDGILDGMWAIVSSHGTEPPYAIGGASRNAGVNLFVDGQDSLSVVVGATGNFNHELAHNLGVPDLYGTFDTLGDLTVMASSWPVPPNDFTAFERTLLGWVDPVVVDQSVTNLVVPSADTHLFAVRIPTAWPDEYFLLEYRKRPAAGFGSSGFDHDGVAIYHVFATSNQSVDPPLLKLEPADRTTAPGLAPERDDLAYPGNPGMRLPLVLRSYFGGDPVFQLDDVHRTADGSIAVDLTVLPTGPGSPTNLIPEPSFETGTADWHTGGWHPEQATFSWASIGANGSQRSLSLASTAENDVEWTTRIGGLQAGRAYYLCGWLRGRDVTGGAGATMSISGTFTHSAALHGTFDWTPRCVVAAASEAGLDVACRLGGFGATSSGQMWCDDVSLLPIDSAFGAEPREAMFFRRGSSAALRRAGPAPGDGQAQASRSD